MVKTASEMREIAQNSSRRTIYKQILKAAYREGKYEYYVKYIGARERKFFESKGYRFKESQLNPGEYIITWD